MKGISRFFAALLVGGLLLAACGSEPTPEPAPPPEQAQEAAPPEEPVVSVYIVSREEFEHTMEEVRGFITELNGIVRSRDYNGWVAHLAPAYFERVNSREFLDNILRNSERLRQQGISLNSARDYFIYVVVPSRTNDRIDDIEFVTRQRIKAFTVNPKDQRRLRLYELENSGNGWRIIN